MVCALNKCAKINACIGVIFMVIGGIVFIAAHVSVAAGFDIETQGGSGSFRVDVGTDSWHGVYIRASDACEEEMFSLATPTISIVHAASNTDTSFGGNCGMINTNADENWEAAHDPPLRSVGSFTPADDDNDCGHTDHCSPDDEANGMCFPQCRKLHGAYQVTCSTDCWVVDLGEEIGEAIGGIMGAIALLIVMAICLIAGTILLCVACCCCCQGPDQPKGGPPVQGAVIGQPVYAQSA